MIASRRGNTSSVTRHKREADVEYVTDYSSPSFSKTLTLRDSLSVQQNRFIYRSSPLRYGEQSKYACIYPRPSEINKIRP